MRGKYWVMITAVSVLVAALVLPGLVKTALAAPKKIKFAYMMPKGRSIAKGFDWFGPEFEKRTEGRYKVEIYPGGILFKTPASLDSIKKGVAEIAMSSIGAFERTYPLSTVTTLPALGFPGTAGGLMAADKAFWEMYKRYPGVQREFKDFKLLWYFQLNNYILVSKKEIRLPSDLKGKKVGGTGSRNTLVEMLGGAPVEQIPPEAYLNMDRGVVDISFLSLSQLGVYKTWEVAKYYLNYGFGGGAIPILMNLKAWNAMPPKDQRIMEETWADAAVVANKVMEAGQVRGVKGIKKGGGIFIEPTAAEKVAWEAAAKPLFDKWIDDAKARGASNPEEVLGYWKKAVAAGP